MSVVYSGLVYEYKPLHYLRRDFYNELNEIQKIKSINKIEYGDYEYSNPTIGTISLKGIRQGGIYYLDTTRIKTAFTDDSSISVSFLGERGALNLQFGMNFVTAKNPNGKANFFIKSGQFELVKEYEIVDKNVIIKLEVKLLSYIIEDITYNGKQNHENWDILRKALDQYFTINKIADQITSAFTKDINDYYSAKNSKENVTTLTPSLKNVKFKLNLAYDILPKRVTNGLIFYRKGNLNAHEVVALEPEVKEDSLFQVLISKNIFFDFITDLAANKSLDFTIRANSPITLSYKLNIENVAKVIPQVGTDFIPTDTISVYSYVSPDVTDLEEGPITAQVIVHSEIRLEKDYTTVFEFDAKLNLDIQAQKKDNLVDFFVSAITVVDVTSQDAKYKEFDKVALVKFNEEAYNAYIKQYHLSFLNKQLDFNYLFNEISALSVDANGVILYGTPLYEKNKTLKFMS